MNESTQLTTVVPKSELATAELRAVSLTAGRRYPSADEWQQIMQAAGFIWTSGIAEGMQLKNEAQVITIGLKGWELGLPLMASLEGIRLIRNRPQLAAGLMESLAVERIPGARIDWVEMGENGRATCIARRPGRRPIKITFTEAMAKRAGLLNKDTYREHPDELYRAGALRKACWLQYKDLYFGFAPPPTDVVLVEGEDGLDVLDASDDAPPAAPASAPALPPAAPPAPAAPAPTLPAALATPEVSTAPANAATGRPPAPPPALVAPSADTTFELSRPSAPPDETRPRPAEVVAPAQAVPVDATLPFKSGDYAEKKLSDLKEADFRKLLNGYRRAIQQLDPEAADVDTSKKEKEGWVTRLEAWAAYRGVKTTTLAAPSGA